MIDTAKSEIIMNGGLPLKGCPTDYGEANAWEREANKEKDDCHEPKWSFDCGFKLDFDGPILDVSSRFYPPKEHYGPNWDGVVTILLFGKTLNEKNFEVETLDELKEQVESYVKSFTNMVKNHKPTFGPKDVIEALAAIGIKKSIRWVQKHAPGLPGVYSNSSGIQIPPSCIDLLAAIPDLRGKRKE